MAEDKAKTLTGAAAKAAEAKKKRETAKAAEAAAATGIIGEQSPSASETPPAETKPKTPEQTPGAPATGEATEKIIELIDGTAISVVQNSDGTRSAYGEDNGVKMLLASGEYRSSSGVYTIEDGIVINEKESDIQTPETGKDPAKSKKATTAKTTEPSKTKVADDPYQALAAQYAKMYPRNKTFHITSDLQVFLEGDERLARMHQNGLEGGEVKSIKVE